MRSAPVARRTGRRPVARAECHAEGPRVRDDTSGGLLLHRGHERRIARRHFSGSDPWSERHPCEPEIRRTARELGIFVAGSFATTMRLAACRHLACTRDAARKNTSLESTKKANGGSARRLFATTQKLLHPDCARLPAGATQTAPRGPTRALRAVRAGREARQGAPRRPDRPRTVVKRSHAGRRAAGARGLVRALVAARWGDGPATLVDECSPRSATRGLKLRHSPFLETATQGLQVT